MTQFEVMLLERMQELTDKVGAIDTRLARYEERERGRDQRLEELESPPSSRAAPRARRWKGAGIHISNATVSAIVAALLTHFSRAPSAPPAPAPAHIQIEAQK